MSGSPKREVVESGTDCLLREFPWRQDISDLANVRYNVTPSAAYTYAPAYRRYGHKINAVHFIGPNKPWASLKHRPPGTPNLDKKDASYDCQYIF